MLIKHEDDEHFVLNLGSTHNFVDLTCCLPAHIYELKPLQEDRLAFHTAIALKAKSARTSARAQTAAKRRATAASKKQAAGEAAEAAAEAEREAEKAEAAAGGAADEEEEGSDLDSDAEDSDDNRDQPATEQDAQNGEDDEENDSDAYIPGRTRSAAKRKRGTQRGRGGGRKRRK